MRLRAREEPEGGQVDEAAGNGLMGGLTQEVSQRRLADEEDGEDE